MIFDPEIASSWTYKKLQKWIFQILVTFVGLFSDFMHYFMSEHVQQKRIFWTWLRFGICQTCHLVVNLKMPEMTIFDQNREKLKWSQIQILPNQRNPSRNITKSFNFKFLVESLWCRYLNLNRLSQKWN